MLTQIKAIHVQLWHNLICAFFFFFATQFSFIYTSISSFLYSHWPLLRHTISNNRPSTAPRGLRHAILNISISAGLFGRVCVCVCASGNRRWTIIITERKDEEPSGEEGDGGDHKGWDQENKEKIDQNSIKQNSALWCMRIWACAALACFLSGSKGRRLPVRVSPREIPTQQGIYSSSVFLNDSQRLKHTDTYSYLIYPPWEHW